MEIVEIMEMMQIEKKEQGAEALVSGRDCEKRDSRGENARVDQPIPHSTFRVQLPREAAIRVHAALQKLKERKADVKADELLSRFLNGITDQYLNEEIDEKTPIEYYFEAAKNIPELRQKIIKSAKRALESSLEVGMGEKALAQTVPQKERRKTGAKTQEGSEVVNHGIDHA